MSKTKIHIQKGRFNQGVDTEATGKFKRWCDRHNFERGKQKNERNKLRYLQEENIDDDVIFGT